MVSVTYGLLTGGLLFATVVSFAPLDVNHVPKLRSWLRWLDKLVLRSKGGVTWNMVIISFLIGWWTTELTPHVILFHSGVSSFLLWCGWISWEGEATLLYTQVICYTALTILYIYSGRTAAIGDKALQDSLGPDYKESIHRTASDRRLSLYEWVRTLSIWPLQRHPLITKHRDVPFSDAHHRLKVDFIYKKDKPKNAPVFFYVHGGAWVRGEKTNAPILLAYLAARGYLCVSTNYRLAPQHDMLCMMEDLKCALTFVKKECVRYGGDPNFIVCSGGSAGGHLASLLALSANDPRFQPGFEDADTTVQGCVSMYGVYNLFDQKQDDGGSFTRFLEKVLVKKSIEDDPDLFRALSPQHRITKDSPPFMVIQGTVDNLVPVHIARDFVAKFREVHPKRSQEPSQVSYLELPFAHHAFDITPSLRSWQTNELILNYLDYWHVRYLKGEKKQ